MLYPGLEKKFLRTYPYTDDAKKCPVFKEVKPLVADGILFPAIREKELHFYHSGQRAFLRKQSIYKSNDFYLNGDEKKKSSSSDLSFRTLPYEEKTGMGEILMRCREKAKSGPEGLQLSKLFPFYSFASTKCNFDMPFLVDVEARFSKLDQPLSKRTFDKIDLVFYVPQNESLLFVEGKRRGDNRVQSVSTPEVVGQIARYEKQLLERRDEILKAYKENAELMNKIFGIDMPVPRNILPKVPVLIVDEPGTFTSENDQAKDTWLRPALIENQKTGRRIWNSDEPNSVFLIDGREIFYKHETMMPELGNIMNEVASKIA